MLLKQVRHFITPPGERVRPFGRQSEGRRPFEGNQAQLNRLMMVRIGWTLSFLMFLASFAQDGNHVGLFERLLTTCALADMVLAVLLWEKWSTTSLSRWDEAILFMTLAMGLSLFAG
ncbi:hypothetical protein [Lichenihabitans psoromatis]|uniref:hypothetical protein n=1 Tax=Lichenihabitans psoromatis TaxID=2528642 RepID=UPI0013F16D84|nr:hypothetical protein [Lichenihabitans psoromatis]